MRAVPRYYFSLLARITILFHFLFTPSFFLPLLLFLTLLPLFFNERPDAAGVPLNLYYQLRELR